MKIFSRFYLLPFLFLDAVILLAIYLLIGQAQRSHSAPLADTAPASPAPGQVIAQVISPSPTARIQTTIPPTVPPSVTDVQSPTLTQTETPRPSPTATDTASPSPTTRPTETQPPTATASNTPLPSPTSTAVVDLGILVVPTMTLSPTPTPVQDLGFLPSLTPSATRVLPTRIPVKLLVASVPSPLPPHTPVPAAPVYVSAMPECVPHGLPVEGILTQRFSRYHSGVDLAIPLGSTVLATQGGQVIFAGWRNDGYGNLVILQNGRFITYYAHNSKLNVTAGQIIHPGEPISLSGSTGWSSGPHVHYEVWVDNSPVNPLSFDPQQYPACQ